MRHQTPRRPLADGNHGGLADLRVRAQSRLNLAGLDAVSAELNLLIGTAQELKYTFDRPRRQVTRAVHPRAGGAEWVGQEGSGRQPRPSEVACANAWPATYTIPHMPGATSSRASSRT